MIFSIIKRIKRFFSRPTVDDTPLQPVAQQREVCFVLDPYYYEGNNPLGTSVDKVIDAADWHLEIARRVVTITGEMGLNVFITDPRQTVDRRIESIRQTSKLLPVAGIIGIKLNNYPYNVDGDGWTQPRGFQVLWNERDDRSTPTILNQVSKTMGYQLYEYLKPIIDIPARKVAAKPRLKMLQYPTASIVLQPGYISNKDDVAYLSSEEGKSQLSGAIADFLLIWHTILSISADGEINDPRQLVAAGDESGSVVE